ncbi:DUF2188 domain-containing protein [Bradyrhizobium sp. CCGUVB23]|nr:DUF2188 domain-containing protein [Bradyrhizobium sp. CCGUVB23]
MVALNGEHFGPYATQEEAIRAAVDAAHKVGKAGHGAQVLVLGRDQKFRTEWTYGHAPYPPRG